MSIENYLHTYEGARAIMGPFGDILIALEIQAATDAIKALEIELEGDMSNISISFLEPMGYLIYHPEIAAGMTVCFQDLDLFTDLGEL